MSELIGELNQFFTQNYDKILVEGEVSQSSKASSGHIYFTLKDEDQAVLNCALFKWNIKVQTDIKPGDKLIVMGKLNIYDKSGKLSMVVSDIKKSDGSGLWFKKFQELKEKLSRKGYFDPEHKRELPRVINSIGIITSPTGAAMKDLLSVLKKRFSHIKIILYPSPVQGANAPQTIIKGINFFNDHYSNKLDAIVLTRGGGSIEDLWCFNDEKLADEIYRSELPIISAVGHERDFSISDFVADIRSATPTSAGELIAQDNSAIFANINIALLRQLQILNQRLYIKSGEIKEFKTKFNYFMSNIENITRTFDHYIDTMGHLMDNSLKKKNEKLSKIKEKFYRIYSPQKVDYYEERFKKMILDIGRSINGKIIAHKKRNYENWDKLSIHMDNKLNIEAKSIGEKWKLLSSLSPLNILQRGYAILLKNGKTVKSYESVKRGDKIRGILHKGEIILEVKDGKEKREL